MSYVIKVLQPGESVVYSARLVRGTGGSLAPIRNIGDPLAFRNNITAG